MVKIRVEGGGADDFCHQDCILCRGEITEFSHGAPENCARVGSKTYYMMNKQLSASLIRNRCKKRLGLLSLRKSNPTFCAAAFHHKHHNPALSHQKIIKNFYHKKKILIKHVDDTRC